MVCFSLSCRSASISFFFWVFFSRINKFFKRETVWSFLEILTFSSLNTGSCENPKFCVWVAIYQAPVFQMVNSAIHWINLYPIHNAIDFEKNIICWIMFYLVDSTIQHLNNLGKNRLKTTSNLETHFDFFVIFFLSFRLELNMELPSGQQQPIGTASAASAEQVLNYFNGWYT